MSNVMTDIATPITQCEIFTGVLITARKRNSGKVMFLQASVHPEGGERIPLLPLDMVPGYLPPCCHPDRGLGYLHLSPPPILTPCGGHQNTYGRQVGETHSTGILFCLTKSIIPFVSFSIGLSLSQRESILKTNGTYWNTRTLQNTIFYGFVLSIGCVRLKRLSRYQLDLMNRLNSALKPRIDKNSKLRVALAIHKELMSSKTCTINKR